MIDYNKYYKAEILLKTDYDRDRIKRWIVSRLPFDIIDIVLTEVDDPRKDLEDMI